MQNWRVQNRAGGFAPAITFWTPPSQYPGSATLQYSTQRTCSHTHTHTHTHTEVALLAIAKYTQLTYKPAQQIRRHNTML